MLRARWIAGAVAGAALAALAGEAVAADETKYQEWRTLEYADDVCHALKYFERSRLDGNVADALGSTDHRALFNDKRLNRAEYDAWQNGIDSAALARAKAMPCTQETAKAFEAFRTSTDEEIYSQLLIGLHLAELPAFDDGYRPMTEADNRVAGVFDGFVREAYGAGYDTFVADARILARMSIDKAVADYNTDGLIVGVDGALEDLAFEVYAETTGLHLYAVPRVNGYGAGLFTSDGTLLGRVINGPSIYRIGGEPQLHGVLVLAPGHEIRLLTYGPEAEALAPDTRIQLWVRTKPAPAGKEPWEYFTLGDWHKLATAYAGKQVDTGCLDGPCYAFPMEALASMKATEAGEYADLFIARDKDDKPISDPTITFERNGISNYALSEYLGLE